VLEHFDMMRLEKDLHEIGYSLTPHAHDCYLILIVTRGGGSHTVDGENFRVEPNTIFLLSPGQVHSFEFTKDIAGFVVYFTLDFYLHYARERHFDKIPFFRSMHPQTVAKANADLIKSIVVILEEMLNEVTRNMKAREEALRNLLDILLIRINRVWAHDQIIPGKVSSVVQFRKLVHLIEKHYKKIKTAGEYARLMNLSPNHLNTLCKQSVKRTVTEMIHERIIREAKRQLAYTDWGVKKIADDIGFKDSSYFLRLFKKKTGMTPDRFRSDSNAIR
jgi:AraC-like DNA-binding protein